MDGWVWVYISSGSLVCICTSSQKPYFLSYWCTLRIAVEHNYILTLYILTQSSLLTVHTLCVVSPMFLSCAVLRAGSVRVKEDETFPDPAEVAGLNLSSETSASITLPSQLLASRSQGQLLTYHVSSCMYVHVNCVIGSWAYCVSLNYY